jgi:hypothetical protein
MPVNVSRSPSVIVSPMLIVPWLCRPMMSPTHVEQAHALGVAAGADAHERDPVAVARIHIGLDLEDEAGQLLLERVHGARRGRARQGRRRVLDECGEQFRDAEIVDRGTEEHRRLATRQVVVVRERV